MVGCWFEVNFGCILVLVLSPEYLRSLVCSQIHIRQNIWFRYSVTCGFVSIGGNTSGGLLMTYIV